MYTLDTNAIIYYLKGDLVAVFALDEIFRQEVVIYTASVGLCPRERLRFMGMAQKGRPFRLILSSISEVERSFRWILGSPARLAGSGVCSG